MKVGPALKVNGEFVPNPFVITARWVDNGQIVYGEVKTGAEKAAAKETLARGEVDLTLLDQAVEKMIFALAMTPPSCLTRTVESRRERKLGPGDRHQETSRERL